MRSKYAVYFIAFEVQSFIQWGHIHNSYCMLLKLLIKHYTFVTPLPSARKDEQMCFHYKK